MVLKKKSIRLLVEFMKMDLLSCLLECILKKEKLNQKLLLPKVKNNLIKGLQKKQEIGTVKKQDTLENQVNSVYLAFGSNLGDRKKNLNKALNQQKL